MARTSSYFAQASFNLQHSLYSLSRHANRAVSILARIAAKLNKPIAKKLALNHTVTTRVYGRSMTMPAEHPLPGTLIAFPQYNRSLGLAAIAVAQAAPELRPTFIDVGANIGETIAVIEQYLPRPGAYLCLEPHPDIAVICSANHAHSPDVEVRQVFIGEHEGASVHLEDDGRANPSTKSSLEEDARPLPNSGRLVRLDTLALPFAEAQGSLSLLKVDTEGYDFSVLRSGPELLRLYQPAVFLEWYPELLIALNEEVWSGFDYLATFGYRHFVFFTGEGDLYCNISSPSRTFIRGLASVALHPGAPIYFDVFASTSEATCDALVELAIAANRAAAKTD